MKKSCKYKMDVAEKKLWSIAAEMVLPSTINYLRAKLTLNGEPCLPRAASALSDYGYIIDNGRICYQGPVEELTDNDEVRRICGI